MTRLPLSDIPRFHAENKPANAPAITIGDRALTWLELERRSNQRARLLARHGVRAGDFVTLATRNCVEAFENSFALWKLGAIPNVISHNLPAGELLPILDLLKPVLVIGTGDYPGQYSTVAVDADLEGLDDRPFDYGEPQSSWKALTSGGSTGRPKIIVDHTPAIWDVGLSLLNMPINGTVLAPSPLYHSTGFTVSHISLFTGNHIISVPKFDPEDTLRLIEQHRVEWAILVPTMMSRVFALPPKVRNAYDLSSLRAVWSTAAAMPAWLKQAWIDWLGPSRIWEIYGVTEGPGGTTIDGNDWLRKPGSVGRPLPIGQIATFREDGSRCDVGEVGEIHFLPETGAGSTYHYIGADPRRRADGWESQGDLGWLDEEGFLFLADRRTDLILRGGANIYPAEVEAALEAHPGIASSVVIGLPDEDLGQRVHAIVEAPGPLLVDDMLAFLASRLAKYKLPESFEITRTALRDEAGKVRRSRLRDERIDWLREGRAFKLSTAASGGSPEGSR